MELIDKSHDVEFGDPELTKWDWNDWRPMPPEKAEGKVCDRPVFGAKYILPSGRVAYLTLAHVRNEWELGFEVVYPESDMELVPTPGKLVFIKHNVYDSCRRPARYFNEDGGDIEWVCGVCCGKEELPPGRPTLTIEMIEAAMDKFD
jgi:hypothetical protein